jgi:hypothetical protein
VGAAVVELDALADAVGAAAEDHDLARVRRRIVLPGRVVGGVVVGLALDTADGHRAPGLDNAEALALLADRPLADREQARQVLVGKAFALGRDQQVVGRQHPLVVQDLLLALHELAHLLHKVGSDGAGLEDLLVGGALAQRLVEHEVRLAARLAQHQQQLIEGALVEIPGEAQAVASVLEAADRLLQRLLVGLADGHDLADGLHLGAELVLHTAELLEGPAGELQHYVVAAGCVLLQRAVAPVGQFVERHAGGELGRDQRDGKAGGLRGERRGARGAGVDLDHHGTVVGRIVGELHIGTADDADLLDDPEGHLLQTLHHLRGDCQHRGGAEGVARMHAHGVDILDRADADHLVPGIAHHLVLEFHPALERLLDQHLARHGERQAAGGDHTQFLHVVDEAAAGAAHRVGRTHHQREADLRGQPLRLVQRAGHARVRRLDSDFRHELLEYLAILAALDGFQVYTDNLDIVLGKDTGLAEGHGHVEPSLPAEVGQQRVGTLAGDDLLQPLQIERLDVGHIRHDRIRHDRGGVRVDQDDLVSKLAQRLARLGARVVEFTSLPDHNRPGTDDEHFSDVVAPHVTLQNVWNGANQSRRGWMHQNGCQHTARLVL